jgi:GNAT superfamily N-acetyltransferase
MIRNARPEDLPAITQVRISVTENHLSVEQMAERGITPQSVIAEIAAGDLGAWVCEEKREVVAFAMADRRDASIFALFTKPGCEGRGYGSQLLAEAEAWLATRGHREFWLSTARGTRAEAFYARKGWMPASDNAETPDDIIFRKKIPPM